MRIAAHVLAYNVDRFINPMLENLSPHVDRIYLAYPSRPFGYIKESRDIKKNPTSLTDIDIQKYGNQIKVIEGDWLTEEDTRNECFDLAKDEGFDWLIIQDADEFYSEEQWMQLKNALLRYKNEDLLITTWYNFWKSSRYVILEGASNSIKSINAGFALRCKPDLKFVQQRKVNYSACRIIDAPCFHYGYVQSDLEIIEKIKTWSHAGQFNPEKWLELKWMGWNEKTKNIHVIHPKLWRCAIPFPNVQPDFAEQFNLDFEIIKPNFSHQSKEVLYDTKASTFTLLSQIKAFFH